MKLEKIIKDTGASILHGSPATEISSITSDSRKACPGALFIAVKGCNADGHAFIDDAIAKGAAAVVDAAGAWPSAPTISTPIPPANSSWWE